MSLALIFSTFGLIFLAELPDKTALAALLLSTRYRARDVILGAWLAFVVQTVVGVVAGSVLTLLPRTPIQVASGIGFLIFAVLAIRRMGEDEKAGAIEETKEFEARKKSRPIWLVSFLVIFAAEWGDLTQLATAALVARNGHPFSIGLGAILGLWAVTLVAATAGSQLGKYVKPRLINLISGILFAAIGVFIIASALL
jgi:putative Ca2+/H+ antiporter (TMEM165/GDT1 family)